VPRACRRRNIGRCRPLSLGKLSKDNSNTLKYCELAVQCGIRELALHIGVHNDCAEDFEVAFR